MTEMGFEPRSQSYGAYIPNHLTLPILDEFYDWHRHQNYIPRSKSHSRIAVQKLALHEKSVTTLF